MKSSNKSDRVVPVSQIIRIAKICTKKQCSAERVLENVVLVAILSIRQGIPASAARMTGCSFCFAVYLSTSREVLTTLHSQRGMNPQIQSQHPSQLIKWLKLPETENLQPSISAKKKLGSCICSKLPDSEFHSIRLSQTVSDSSNGLPSPLLRNRIHSGCTVPMTQCHLKLFPISPSTGTCQVSKPAPPSASIHRCNRPVTLWLMQQRLLEQLIIEIG